MKNNNKISYILAVVAVVILAGIVLHYSKNPTPAVPAPVIVTPSDPSSLPGLQTGTVPFISELTNLKPRLEALGLPALPEEGTKLHIHQHLDLYINGQVVAIPAGIGINEAARFISPIHVHDQTGVIHVESPTIQDFTLGQFFDIWGVKFTTDCIGGYCTSATQSLKVYINGELYQGDPTQIVLKAHQEIAIAYGTTDQIPHPMPISFTFPDGE